MFWWLNLLGGQYSWEQKYNRDQQIFGSKVLGVKCMIESKYFWVQIVVGTTFFVVKQNLGPNTF